MSLQRSAAITLWAALAAAALLFAFEPATTWWFPSCPLRALTGWSCPLCGSLRALHALLHGAPLVAFGLNPLTTIGLAAVVLVYACDAADPAQTTRHVDWFFARCFGPGALGLAILFGVVRNASFGWFVP